MAARLDCLTNLPPLNVREFAPGSPEYEASLDLRRRYLREPLGLELTPADTQGEDAQRHFGLFDDQGRLAASVIGMPLDSAGTSCRIRQMVVDADQRGRGLGRQLLLGAEEHLAAAGGKECLLYARIEAAGFYRACGYELTGETVELIGMPHHAMRKPLGSSPQ